MKITAEKLTHLLIAYGDGKVGKFSHVVRANRRYYQVCVLNFGLCGSSFAPFISTVILLLVGRREL